MFFYSKHYVAVVAVDLLDAACPGSCTRHCPTPFVHDLIKASIREKSRFISFTNRYEVFKS